VVDASSSSFVEVLVSSADMHLRLGVARVAELPTADDAVHGNAGSEPAASAGTGTGTSRSMIGGSGLTRRPTPNEPTPSEPTPSEHEPGYTFDCAYIELRGCARLGLLLRGTQLSLYCVRSGGEAWQLLATRGTVEEPDASP
jgi:hypothetical protein